MTELNQMGQAARAASRQLAVLSTAKKTRRCWPSPMVGSAGRNRAGCECRGHRCGPRQGVERGAARPAAAEREAPRRPGGRHRRVATLPDPVGAEYDGRVLPNGMRLCKRRIPIGVIGVIYEARPNVTIDIATLCLKTGNAAILRGGSETSTATWRSRK